MRRLPRLDPFVTVLLVLVVVCAVLIGAEAVSRFRRVAPDAGTPAAGTEAGAAASPAAEAPGPAPAPAPARDGGVG